MRHSFSSLLLFASLLPSIAFADAGADVNRDFHWGHDNGFRGNERSDRPGNFGRGQLSYGGNGCPAGTMQVVFAPDNLSFTILFDNFVANANSSDGGQAGVMSCEAYLPITVPANQQMEITRVDYSGFVDVPQGGRGTLQSMFNFSGPDQQNDRGGPPWGRGPGGNPGHGPWKDRDRINLQYSFNGPLQQDYQISTGDMSNGRGMPQTEVSPCGGQAQLHIRNSVRVAAPRGEQAQLTLDSIDGRSNAVYYVNWKSCQAQAPQAPAPQPGPPGQCGRFACPPHFGGPRH